MTHIEQHNLTIHDNKLMEKVVEHKNLRRALKRVENNKGAAGVDGMTTEELRNFLRQNWHVIEHQLLHGTYKPQPVRRVEISKPDGGVRELGIPTVLDRFIQQAVQQVLTPIFEPIFSENSYGFRPGRSAKQAVCKAKEYVRDGYTTVIDIDLEKFFDNVNRDILMSKIATRIHDSRMHKLIRNYLKAGVIASFIKLYTVPVMVSVLR